MKTQYKQFTITSTYKGDKAWGANDKNWNNHTITVVNRDTGKRTSFDFCGSIVEPEIKTEKKLLYAFRCFLDDAASGFYGIDDFQSEYGYEKVSELLRAYKGCQSAARKAKRVIGDEDVLCDLLNALSDDGIK